MVMKIYVKTFTGLGRTYSFDAEPSMIVQQLKNHIREKTGDDNDSFQKMSLLFNENDIDDDNKTLQYYNIKENTLLELHDSSGNFRDIGCLGMKFVDVSTGDALKRCIWSKQAPPWRKAARGLCLEGICRNSECNAFKQQVIISIGYKRFDVINEADETTVICPECEQYVEPKICGFNNCWWRFEGKKIEDGKPPKKCSSDWKHADDAYHYFDDKETSMVTWRQLILEAVKEKPNC
ncbi:unnamed protein product [Rotaria magnacalcarata]|uniref:Ubiquitin-like domain-containing protein n=2 Tax=Rotaria magnacalcarata TaxID=392030 RepID=A0A816X5W1_9BILA|nr:unnamed protein product [Rotaria magnacalcarata]